MRISRFRQGTILPPTLPIPRHAEPIRFEFDAAVRVVMPSLPVERDNDLVNATLRQFALYAQGLPDAQGQQTLWDCALAEVQKALMKTSTLPATTEFSLVDWQTSILSQTVLEQLAQSLAVWRIELLDERGHVLGEWIPTIGPMTTNPNAVFYRVFCLRVRCQADLLALNSLHLVALLAPQVLPSTGLDLMVRAWPYHTDQTHAARTHESTHQDTAASKPAHQKRPASTLAAALHTALHDYVDTLLQRDALNHLNGSGWVYEHALYLIGKEAAAALREHPTLVDWKSQFHKNTVLYRALLAQRLSERCGDKPVWNLIVKQEGATRKVAAIKMPLTDEWRTLLKSVPLFHGTLDWPNAHTAAPRPAAPLKPPAAARRTAIPDYTTLFNERSS